MGLGRGAARDSTVKKKIAASTSFRVVPIDPDDTFDDSRPAYTNYIVVFFTNSIDLIEVLEAPRARPQKSRAPMAAAAVCHEIDVGK